MCMCACNVCLYACMYVCKYVYMHVCMYLCMYVFRKPYFYTLHTLTFSRYVIFTYFLSLLLFQLLIRQLFPTGPVLDSNPGSDERQQPVNGNALDNLAIYDANGTYDGHVSRSDSCSSDSFVPYNLSNKTNWSGSDKAYQTDDKGRQNTKICSSIPRGRQGSNCTW